MSSMNITLMEILLKEIGDLNNIKPFSPVMGPEEHAGMQIYYFHIDDTNNCVIYFEDVTDEKDKIKSDVAKAVGSITNIVFLVNEQQISAINLPFDKFLRLMKTIRDTCVKHIKKTDPDMIIIKSDLPTSAPGKTDADLRKEEQTKSKYYKEVIANIVSNLKSMGYTYSVSPGNVPEYHIFKDIGKKELRERLSNKGHVK